MRGRIVSFSGADGFGSVRLEDGRLVRFGTRECAGIPPVPGLDVEVSEVVPGHLPGQLRASRLVPAVDLATLPWREGRIAAYDAGSLEGMVALADGEVATFSGGSRGDLRWLPRPDLAVRVRVAGGAVVELDEATPLPAPAEALARMQEAGFARELGMRDLQALLPDPEELEEAPRFFEILDHWYCLHPERARRDGWLHHDLDVLDEVADPIAELAAFSGHPPVLALVRLESVETDAAGEWVFRVTVRPPQGAEETFEARDYDAFVARYNAALAAAGARKLFHAIDTQDDFYLHLLLAPDRARQLDEQRVLPIDWPARRRRGK